jgi:hypothetical protein
MRWWTRSVLALGLAAAAGGCRNACADLCLEMAEYAEECGYTVSDEEIDTCISEQSAAGHDERKACREFGQGEVLRAQWSCDVLADYWEPEDGGGEESP